MTKVKSSAVFKQYNQQQSLLLPPSLDELIGKKHLVRVVNQVVESMDISKLINLYQGGGTSSYHPRMLLKVLLYAYSVKIYTGRKMARALSQDIHFMWLSGMSRPDFRTLNNFRSSKAKEVIEVLFAEMLQFLMDHQYIKMENYFCDGSSFRADANEHKVVWKKNASRFKQRAEEKCKVLFKQIDAVNATEDKEYGQTDLEENGQQTMVSKSEIEDHIERLNQKMKSVLDKRTQIKIGSLDRQLRRLKGKINKYENQMEIAGNRSGYSKTDPDASAMMMKNKVEILPAYNVLAGCEEQFITGVSVHQNPNDGTCFKGHLETVIQQQPTCPENIIADAAFGTIQNYEILEQRQINSYLKFATFQAEQSASFKDKAFLKENFYYDTATDTYSCPNDELLVWKRTFTEVNKRLTIKEYECTDCSECIFYKQCCKSPNGLNRTIQVNERLEDYKSKARINLKSDKGKILRKRRSIEIESCFGDIKHNMGFRRFNLRGINKVKTEINLIAMAHNLRKINIKTLKTAA